MEFESPSGIVEKSAKKSHMINFLTRILGVIVKLLALLMVLVIAWATVDVVVHLYQQMRAPIETSFNIERLINLLGVFLGVLIAIEVFANIVFYLMEDSIHLPLVISTALTAAARKVIIIDYSTILPFTLMGLAALILSLGIAFWLVSLTRHK